jgi:hypothetical protein
VTLTTPTRTRTLPVRLSDIPLAVRAHAAQQAAKRVDQAERTDLLAAALKPSDTVYFVHADAAPLLRAWKDSR